MVLRIKGSIREAALIIVLFHMKLNKPKSCKCDDFLLEM